MQGFQGYGYSPDFVERMKHIIEVMYSDSSDDVEIVSCCDDICDCCPHNVENVCQKTGDNGKNIRETDALILRKLGFREGYCANFMDLIRYVNRQLDKDDVLEICGECAWKEKCLWYMKNVGLKY